MPTYEYECSEQHPFEVRSSISNKPEHPACPCLVVAVLAHLCPNAATHTEEAPSCEACPREEPVVCGEPGHQVIRTVPTTWIPGENKESVFDYPGSKRWKAGHIHYMVDPGVKKVSSGYGGVLNPKTAERHPVGKAVQAEWRLPPQ